MMRVMLYEAAQIVLVRMGKWSWLKAWAMKIARHRGVKKAIVAIAQSNSRATVGEVRYAFQLRSAIDNIDVIGAKDLDITKEGNEVVISFAYPKRIPLFGNVNVVIDFAASSNN